jgi:hypothetical protein
MFGKQEMTAVRLRKQTLLLESDLNRLTLCAECEHLREAANWSGRVEHLRQQVGPWALVLAPLAGAGLMLGLRRFSSGAGLLPKALAVAPALIKLWRTCAAPSHHSR